MIIGIGHTIKCGKDLVCQMLTDEIKKQAKIEFIKNGFSHPLKRRVAFTWGIDDYTKLHDQDFKNSVNPYLGITYREILQREGECLRNAVHDRYHIEALFKDYYDDTNWILTDVRHMNEMDTVNQLDGVTIKVNRSFKNKFPKIWKQYLLSRPITPSESGFLRWLKYHNNLEHNKLYNVLTHNTETSLNGYIGWDFIIDNNYDIDYLQTQIKDIVKVLIKDKKLIK